MLLIQCCQKDGMETQIETLIDCNKNDLYSVSVCAVSCCQNQTKISPSDLECCLVQRAHLAKKGSQIFRKLFVTLLKHPKSLPLIRSLSSAPQYQEICLSLVPHRLIWRCLKTFLSPLLACLPCLKTESDLSPAHLATWGPHLYLQLQAVLLSPKDPAADVLVIADTDLQDPFSPGNFTCSLHRSALAGIGAEFT